MKTLREIILEVIFCAMVVGAILPLPQTVERVLLAVVILAAIAVAPGVLKDASARVNAVISEQRWKAFRRLVARSGK